MQPGQVPPDAQAIIDSIVRSAPNSSDRLLEAIQPLIELGLSPEEAMRVGFGGFPIAGETNFIHDWYFPRYGPGFRFHQGTDMFAPYGTPLRAVTDGTLRATNNGLGGMVVRVVQPDGTYYYYAHLSALVEDYVEGMTVERGDIIGYVGDSGNARGGTPHLHFGIYVNGAAVDPKPYLDQAIEDAIAAMPDVIADIEAAKAAGDQRFLTRRGRSVLATNVLRGFAERAAAGIVATEALFQAAGNPTTGGVAVVEGVAAQLAARVDWDDDDTAADQTPVEPVDPGSGTPIAAGEFAD